VTAPDTQRAKVYEAEALVRRIFDRATDFPIVDVAGSHVTLPPERKFASLQSVQAYVDAVLALSWVRERWPRAELPVIVRARAGQSRAHYEWPGSVIAVPLHRGGRAWALRELVLLHEIAHHLAPEDEPAHGAAYVARIVELVTEIVGAEAGFLLRVTLLDSGVQMG
jgi:putative metallohydrolase (TIGR04338 family)